MKLLILFLLFCGAMTQNKENEPEKKSKLTEGVNDTSGEQKLFGSWETHNGRKLRFFSTPASWANAHMHCQALGGHLAVINSQREDQFVKRLAGGQKTWIGLSDAQQNDFWFWINSEPLGYINWCPGEPNNQKGQQHCALTNFSDMKCWDDQDCFTSYPYVCEK